jgi:hypothetical protein
LQLRIHRLAVTEIDHEVDYCESCSVGLGAELEDEIDAVPETIIRFPQAAPNCLYRLPRVSKEVRLNGWVIDSAVCSLSIAGPRPNPFAREAT